MNSLIDLPKPEIHIIYLFRVLKLKIFVPSLNGMKGFLYFCFLFCFPLLLNAQEQPLFQADIPFDHSGRMTAGKNLAGSPTRSGDSLIAACIADLNTDSIASYIQSLENFGTRFLLAENRRDVAVWIRDKFIALGYPTAVLDSFECTTTWPASGGTSYTTWQYNVLATLPGTQNPEVHTLIGGHHDAIVYSGGDPFVQAPGADDNASSVAAVLEIARVIKLHNLQPATSLCFASWAAEERGLFGSIDYVIKSLNLQRNIKAYINLDMIANEPGSTNWRFNVNQYSGSEYLGVIAKDIALAHTTLSPEPNTMNSQGSDSYPFWLGGYPVVYFSEKNFSPNYHQITDLLSACNIPYCREICKVAMGTLLRIDEMPSAVQYDLFNPGTGNSLLANWVPNPETNLAGYFVRVGYSSGLYHQSFTTTANGYNLQGLSPDTTYYIAVSAFNTEGIEGPIREYSDRPVLVTMDQGILIVDDSEGGILNPEDSAVDAFYSALLHNFTSTEYDAFQAQEIGLPELGKYSSVLWHVNKQTGITTLNRNLPEVVKYLRLGGNILFTLYQPQRAISKLTNYPINWPVGSFIHDYLFIDTITHLQNSAFNHGSPATPGYPLIEVDTSKTPATNTHHLSYIEALSPSNDGSVIYMYGTAYNSSTAQGSMAGLPVGVESNSPDFKTITLSFPLYYMNFAQARNLVWEIMVNKFGETPMGLNTPEKESGLQLYPNPANATTNLGVFLDRPSNVSIRIYNLLGNMVWSHQAGLQPAGLYAKTISLVHLNPGVYFLRTEINGNAQTTRLIRN